MDNKKAIELIKLSTIGCIGTDDLATLNDMMQDEENFPWKELGEFQNLVVLLPSSLVLEIPSWELKDKVARKLYSLKDEIQSKLEKSKSVEEPTQDTENLIEESVEEIAVTDDKVDFKIPDQSPITFREQPEINFKIEDKFEKQEAKPKPSVDKTLIEKTIKEYVNSYFKSELELTQKSIKKTLFISIVLFILSILLIVFMYFKFSGDMDNQQEEINKIKNRLGISFLEHELKGFSSHFKV